MFQKNVKFEIKSKVSADQLLGSHHLTIERRDLSHGVASGSEITPCNKIDKPLVVYRFSGNVMTSM